jgi:superfamily II DNA or RNA helicase
MASDPLTRSQLAVWANALAEYIERMEGTPAAARALDYAVKGSVIELTEFALPYAETVVAGAYRKLHAQILSREHRNINGVCSCPVGIDCKHCCAAAFRLLAELLGQGIGCKKPYVLPKAWSSPVPSQLPRLRGEGYEDLLNMIEAAGGSHPSKADNWTRVPWWRQFLDAANEAEANVALTKGFRERLPRLGANYYRYPAPTYSEDDNRVDTLIQHDLIVQQAAAYYGMRPKPMDDALSEWMHSAEARALWEGDQERAVRARLLGWLKAKAPSVQARPGSLEFRWMIGQDDPAALPELRFQALLTTQKLSSSPRSSSSLEALLREVDSGTRSVPVAQAKLLGWLINRHQLVKPYDSPTVFPVRHVRDWLLQSGQAVRVEWEDGQPVRLDLHPARLTLSVRDGQPEWTVRLPGTDRSEYAPLSALTIVSEGAIPAAETDDREVFIHVDGVLHPLDTAGMPAEVLQWLVRQPRLSIDALRETAEAAQLLDLYLPYASPETASALVAEVPVRCWLEFRKESKHGLMITARARSADETEFVLGADGQWRLLPSTVAAQLEDDLGAIQDSEPADDSPILPTPPAPALALVERPRRADTAELETWLNSLPGGFLPPPPSLAVPAMRWRMPADGLFLFLDWWLMRPADIPCYGDKKFRAMLQARDVPRYKVSVRPSGKNWLGVSVALEEEIRGLSLEEAARLLEGTQGQLILMKDGGYYRRKDLEQYREQAEMLADLGLSTDSCEQRVHAFQLAGASGDRLALAENADTQWRALRQEMSTLLSDFDGIPRAKLPVSLAKVLRPYQQAGVDFLVWACENFGGAVLADDMGLGKTVQVLAALSCLGEHAGKPSLVVCPASVAHNWQREASRFTPWLKTVVLEAGVDRHEVLDRLGDFDVVIKNYSLARRDAEKLQAQEWLMVCVDEAQAIKNPAAAITATVKSLAPEYRVALTGTPIENRLQDLWSIADFAVPGYLPPLNKVNMLDKSGSGGLGYKALRARLRPILLRRMKAEVAPELPPRIEERLDCAMTTGQKKAYLAELKQARALLESSSRVVGKERIQILAALTRLRQLCCDPELRAVRGTGSGKVEVLMEHLPVVLEAGHKVLVFSQFVQMIKILERRFTKENLPFYTLTGATTKRPELIQRFEEDERPCVFLISLKAGGTGLNLTSATHVFLFDPWWNPAVEAQAIDRTHRIGQDKTVVAFRLVTEGTIEERILELQEEKRGLVKNVLEDEAFNRMLTKDDFKYLLE